MKKLITTAIVFSLLGFVAGNAFFYLAGPIWLDVEVSEGVDATQTETRVATGSFTGADAIHQGRGTATVYGDKSGNRLLRFTEFDVTNGPDLRLWLVAHDNADKTDAVLASDHVSLGRLKGNIGDQNYTLPAGIDLNKYKTVAVWCKQFEVLVASARLTPTP